MLTALSLLCLAATTASHDYFKIKVVDEATGRGVPLVMLETTNHVRWYTDSNGLVAFHEPGLMNQRVFFTVKSHGYEFAKDGFGIPGRALEIKPGGSAELKIKRINIAERLYRVTGGGIYRDSVLLGEAVPIKEPVLNGKVFGQDSVMNAIYGGKLFWFWGDTSWPQYPLGQFDISGATSELPGRGGLDPEVGVDTTYFVGENGFSRPMAPVGGKGPTWTVAPVVLKVDGRERMFSAYAKIKDASMATYARGMTEWNPEKNVFEKVAEWPLDHPVVPSGHTALLTDGGSKYVYHMTPYPVVRVRADVEAIKDIKQYEAFTCLKEGTRVTVTTAPAEESVHAEIDRDEKGRVRYVWKRNTQPVNPKEQGELIKAGMLKPKEALLQLQDVETGKSIHAHGGTVHWNEYRKRWVMIVLEIFGTSMLGEIWYAEADTPLGPWVYARKVVTHDKYSFYNPKQHPYFDKDGGRVIFFEGTYTASFSGNTDRTPRYEYNQVMYKLDLADERLALPVAIYQFREGSAMRLSRRSGAAGRKDAEIVFFAPNRPRKGLIPVYPQERGALSVSPAEEGDAPLFWALPADTKEPPKTTAALYEFFRGDRRVYSTRDSIDGYMRNDAPLCLVWRNPMAGPVLTAYIDGMKAAGE